MNIINPKDYVIFSDMDGTLLTTWDLGPIIVDENISAINRWLNEGGYFSVATGRNLKNVPHFFTDFDLNVPFVLVNGALIYLPKEKKIIYKAIITNEFLQESILYFKINDYITLVLSDEKEVYAIVPPNSRDMPVLNFPNKLINIDNIKDINVLKVSFIIKDGYLDKVSKEIENFNSFSQVNILPSSSRFLEVVSIKANKAIGIKKALEYQNIDRKIICIGDYLNDIAMAEIADYFAAPSNAHLEVKKKADYITTSNNKGAIASLINKLIN